MNNPNNTNTSDSVCFPQPTSTTVSLAQGWTDTNCTASPVTSHTLKAFSHAGYGYTVNGYWYPYYNVICDTYARHVRLTMEEVERLRVAAKKDKALRETLEKFTPLIEVIVDFGKVA